MDLFSRPSKHPKPAAAPPAATPTAEAPAKAPSAKLPSKVLPLQNYAQPSPYVREARAAERKPEAPAKAEPAAKAPAAVVPAVERQAPMAPSVGASTAPVAGPEPAQGRKKIGELLVAGGKVKQEHLDQALKLQRNWGVLLGRVLMSNGWVKGEDLFGCLAEQLNLRFVTLKDYDPPKELLKVKHLPEYNRLQVLPWNKTDKGKVVVASATLGPEVRQFCNDNYGAGQYELVVATPVDVLFALQRRFNTEMTKLARDGLYERNPKFSARRTFTGREAGAGLVILAALGAGLYFAPLATLIAINMMVSVFYLFIAVLRTVLIWQGAHHKTEHKTSSMELASLADAALPIYTVLVPVFREADSLPILAAALKRFDYPQAKLDIKLLLEESDTDTYQAARKLGLQHQFELVRVPPSQPQTKPKALNYGLQLARGEYLTIYDAEDVPDPRQLKKCVTMFRKSPDEVACIQARLNYYNRNENWLTRMFTLEYSMWFDLLMPGLERLGVPMPLGGTSNHFKTSVLRKLGAWDPFNVTEDADLGLRLQQEGYRSEMVNSTTFEEATHKLGNWVRQRSRWIKGYMQTYLVHMRHPIHLYKTAGHMGFWGFQFFIGAPIVALLVNPVLWGVFIACLVGYQHYFDALFPGWVLTVSMFNLLFGNSAMIYFFMLGGFRRRYYRLVLYALTAPVYWALMSVAAFKALWQLIRNPFYWEKTAHGGSDTARQMARAVQ